MQRTVDRAGGQTIQVARWPSEIPLRIAIILVSIVLWLLIIVGTFGLGLIYVVLIAVFLFFVQVGFIAYLRGSAVRLGPDQFPEIYQRVVEFAQRSGMKKEPEAYLMQADGALNAFATKFFRGQMVVLYADLLEACGDDTEARDMIIGHEIGHLRCGHLDWFILTSLGRFIPFLGSAYSRACEYTCDRWGAALSGSAQGARRGLMVLAAGGAHSSKMNVDAYVRQQQNLDTGWMTLARWLGTYPPLSARVDALNPDPAATRFRSSRGPLRAWGIMLSFILVPIAIALAVPHVASFAGGPLGALMGEARNVLGADDDFGAGANTDAGAGAGGEIVTYGSAPDMPPPQEVPQFEDADFAANAVACHGGDMTACDELYYDSPSGSVEEDYGNTCAGRFPGNTRECVEYLAE